MRLSLYLQRYYQVYLSPPTILRILRRASHAEGILETLSTAATASVGVSDSRVRLCRSM